MERIRASEGHSPTASVEHRGTSEDTERTLGSDRHSPSGKQKGTIKTPSRKESQRVKGTHILKCAHGRTSRDKERLQASEWYSPTGEQRRTDKSGYEKNPSEREALTPWKVQMDGQVSSQKESK